MSDFNHSYIGSLVIRAQAGDSDSFAELYALTYKHVFNYAAHYLRDEYLAQDAMQDTYVLALKNIRNIKDPSLFVAWLNQICFHTCYDICKKKNQDYDEFSSELYELVKDESKDHNPEIFAEDRDMAYLLRQAIEKLSFNEKQVIVLRFYNDMKLEEIASVLRISRSTVKRYLKSATENLSNMLERGERQ